MQNFVVPVLEEFKVESGFAMEVGEPLIRWIELNVAGKKKHDVVLPQLKVFLKQVFHGLALLHYNNWSHFDIRPANIVIFNGTARLIDWLTANPCDYHQSWRIQQGETCYFWPKNYEMFIKDGKKWDLISFGYTTIALALGEIEAKKVFEDFDSRQIFVQQCVEGRIKNSLAVIGAKIVHMVEHKVGPLLGTDYDEFLSLFDCEKE